ncbi:hypothetical protein K523DRAFT_95575 [Schizophyllum commune Tattone D]|nr:hypothetical protein K523DRAFT_95575 [Schizophyllum commune Tattone D]
MYMPISLSTIEHMYSNTMNVVSSHERTSDEKGKERKGKRLVTALRRRGQRLLALLLDRTLVPSIHPSTKPRLFARPISTVPEPLPSSSTVY